MIKIIEAQFEDSQQSEGPFCKIWCDFDCDWESGFVMDFCNVKENIAWPAE